MMTVISNFYISRNRMEVFCFFTKTNSNASSFLSFIKYILKIIPVYSFFMKKKWNDTFLRFFTPKKILKTFEHYKSIWVRIVCFLRCQLFFLYSFFVIVLLDPLLFFIMFNTVVNIWGLQYKKCIKNLETFFSFKYFFVIYIHIIISEKLI